MQSSLILDALLASHTFFLAALLSLPQFLPQDHHFLLAMLKNAFSMNDGMVGKSLAISSRGGYRVGLHSRDNRSACAKPHLNCAGRRVTLLRMMTNQWSEGFAECCLVAFFLLWWLVDLCTPWATKSFYRLLHSQILNNPGSWIAPGPSVVGCIVGLSVARTKHLAGRPSSGQPYNRIRDPQAANLFCR